MPLDFFILMLSFSVFFLLPGLLMFGVNRRHRKKYTQITEGTITGFEQVYSNGSYNPHPVYEYFVNGKRYSKRGGYISHAKLSVGSPVCIMYDPDCPTSACIKGHDSKIYTILGSILIGFGSLVIVLLLLGFFLT